METLLRIGLSNAVVALLMALVVVTVACVWRRPAVLHALWLLVLVKLVTPPMVWVSIPWPIIPDSPQIAVAPRVETAPSEPLPEEDRVFLPDSEATTETSVIETDAEPMASGGRKPPDSPSSPRIDDKSGGLRPPLAGTYALCGVWLAGALAWYALALIRLRRFRQMLRHAVPGPESLRQRTQRLAEKLRLRRCPGVWLIPGRVAPMLWAAGGRPRILFPADLLKQVGIEQQNALLVHELAHLRRRDHWVRWLEFIAAGLYWWNPVLWFARRELREAEEQCCDAWVTSTLPGAGKTYATALLETLEFLSDAPPTMPLLASGVGRVVDLKRRLTMIMRGTTPRTLGWRGVAAVVGLGALLLPMLPAWVQAQVPVKAEATEVQLKGDVKVETDALAGEAEKDGVELTKLRAELEQKQAEVAALTARIKAVTARAKKRQGNSFVQTAIFDGGTKGSIIVQTDGPVGKDRIIVQTDGAASDPAKIQELLEQIQAAASKSVFPEVLVTDKTTGKVIMKMEGGKAEVVGPGALLLPPPAGTRWVRPGDPGYHPGQPPLAIAATDTDKRIIDLEMKLKSLLSEVEKLRRERKSDAPQSGSESKPQSRESTNKVSAALATADDCFNEGEYKAALKLYDRIAASEKADIGVKALAGSARCLAVMGEKEELNKRLQEIRSRLDLLPIGTQKQWKDWLDVIERATAPSE